MLEAGANPAAQIDAGEHPGNLSTATTMGAIADHIAAASEQAGLGLALPRAVQRHYVRAIDDGHGVDNRTRVNDGIRTPHAEA